MAVANNVQYIDGGWGRLVAGLEETAVRSGAAVHVEQRVAAVEVSAGHVQGVRMKDGSRRGASHVVIAAPPSIARRLLQESAIGHELDGSQTCIPVRAAALDLALSSLPRPKRIFALGIDQPLYLSVHSATAKLAPAGVVTLNLARYLSPGEDGSLAEAGLEQMADRVQPGWRDVLLGRRFMPALTVTHSLVQAAGGGLSGRTKPQVPGVSGLFVAGDWVGSRGMLADASLASAEEVAGLIDRAEPRSAAA
jgi:phytoene dehydrogenase-like protein